MTQPTIKPVHTQAVSGERSTNFEFLRTLYPYLAEYGVDAEALLDDHPDSSGVRLRRFVEAVVAHIFSKELSNSALPNDLYEQIRVPAFRRVVGDAAVLDDMDAIRRGIGKKGAHHGYDVEKPDVLEGLRAAHRIGQWLVRRSDPSVTIDAFVRPNPGGHRAEKAADLKLRARIAKEDLSRVLAELSVLAPPGLEHPSPSELAEAKELIARYQRSLALQLQERTKAFVAMPRDSAPLITLNSVKRIAVVGPSGVGKSWRVRRNAIALAAEATVILAEAKYFNGDLNKWLDAAVAAHCFRGAGYLLRMSGHLRIPVVIVIDGFDEAPEAHREQLRQGLRPLEEKQEKPTGCARQRRPESILVV